MRGPALYPPPIARFAARAAACCSLVALGGGCERTTRDTDIKFIRVAEVRALVDKKAHGDSELVLLIDPRPKKYFDKQHLPGARSLTLPQVDPKSKIDPTIDKYRTLVVYGDNPASAEARGMTKRLMAVGYSGVRLFAGGLKEWAGRGYPTEGEPAPAAPAPSATPPEPAATTPEAPAPVTPPAAPPTPP